MKLTHNLIYIETNNTIKKSPSEQYILSLESINLSKKFKLTCTEPGLIQKSVKIWVREGVLHIVGLVEHKAEGGMTITKQLSKAFLLPHGIVYEKVTSFFNKHGQLVVELPLLEIGSTTITEKPKKVSAFECEEKEDKIWKLLEERINQQKATSKPTWETKYPCNEEEMEEFIRKLKPRHSENGTRLPYWEEDKEEKICKRLERSDSQTRKTKSDREYEYEWEEKEEKRKFDLEERVEKRDELRKPKCGSFYEWEEVKEEKEDYCKLKKLERDEKAYKSIEDICDSVYELKFKPEHRESKYIFDEKKEKKTTRHGREYMDLLTGCGYELTDKASIYDMLKRK